MQRATDSLGGAQVTFFRHIWGEVNGLDSRGHPGQNDGIFRKLFSSKITFDIGNAPGCDKNNELIRMSVPLFNQKLEAKKRLATLGDLVWPLAGSLLKTCTWVILNGQRGFWENYADLMRILGIGRISIFPHRLIMGRSCKLTSGHRYKKSTIYKFYVLVFLQNSESLKLTGRILWLWHNFKLQQQNTWGRVTWSVLVTWPDMIRNIFFFCQNVRNECGDKVRKFQFGGSRRLAVR